MPLAAALVRWAGQLSSAVFLFLLQDAPLTGSPWVGASFLFLEVEGVGVLTTVRGVGGTDGNVVVLMVVVMVTVGFCFGILFLSELFFFLFSVVLSKLSNLLNRIFCHRPNHFYYIFYQTLSIHHKTKHLMTFLLVDH